MQQNLKMESVDPFVGYQEGAFAVVLSLRKVRVPQTSLKLGPGLTLEVIT